MLSSVRLTNQGEGSKDVSNLIGRSNASKRSERLSDRDLYRNTNMHIWLQDLAARNKKNCIYVFRCVKQNIILRIYELIELCYPRY